MAAHRYWRAVGLRAYAEALSFSEMQLYQGSTRVDALATLTSNRTPVSGAISDLQDGSSTTSATWSDVDSRHLILMWDAGVGSEIEVDNFRLGSGGSVAGFPLFLNIEGSDDGSTWSRVVSARGVAWPGAYAMTREPVYAFDQFSELVVMHLAFDGGNHSLSFVDKQGHIFTPSGAAEISTAQSVAGGASGYFDGSSSYISTPDVPEFNVGISDFTIEAWVRPDSGALVGTARVLGQMSSSGGNAMIQLLLGSGRPSLLVFNANTSAHVAALSPTVLSADTWVHIAGVRSGDNLLLFVDGTLAATTLLSASAVLFDSTSRFSIGRAGDYAADYFKGYVDSFRFTRGIARYTSDFTPIPDFDADGARLNRVRGTASVPAQVPVVPSLATVDTYGTPIVVRPPALARGDYLTGVKGRGIGRVKGTVKETGDPENTPVRRRVRLIRDRDGLLIRETWSDPATGEYDFQYVDETEKFTVLSYDHTGNFRAVVADRLTPELMP